MTFTMKYKTYKFICYLVNEMVETCPAVLSIES